MTALTEYDRLEAPAIWRADADAQRRNVVVSMGEATLAILDQSETALAHWSLPAIVRLNPGESPAIFAPGGEADEILETDDALLIEAIERVQRVVEKRRPHTGRLRFGALSLILIALLVGGVLWLPGAITRHAVQVVPPAVRADTGARLMRHITQLAGEPCAMESARAPLAALENRLLGRDGGQLIVLPGGVEAAEHLPGRIVLLNRALIEDFEDAGPAAGYVVVELVRARAWDPMARLLHHTGPMSALHLLTTGEIPEEQLRDYARTLLTSAPSEIPEPALLAGFQAAGVSVAPYAYALDMTGETVVSLLEGDPISPDTARTVLSDGQWVALQQICEG